MEPQYFFYMLFIVGIGFIINLAVLLFIIKQNNQIMATEQEILALLEEANTATNEIAEDIQKLLDKPGIPDSVRTSLQAHVDRLKGVANLSNEEDTEEPPAP
jgi:hypothetical protein